MIEILKILKEIGYDSIDKVQGSKKGTQLFKAFMKYLESNNNSIQLKEDQLMFSFPDPEIVALTNIFFICFYLRLEDYEAVERLTDKYLEKITNLDDRECYYSIVDKIATFLFQKQKHKLAIKYYHFSINYYEENDLKSLLAATYDNIGTAFRGLGNFSDSMYYTKKSISVNMSINSPNLSYSYNNLATIYYYLEKLDKALEYFLLALRIEEEKNTGNLKKYLYNNIANIYNDTSKFEKAKDFYHKALVLHEKDNDYSGVANVLNNLGIIFQRSGKTKESIAHYHKSLDLCLKHQIKDIQIIALHNLGTLYDDFGDYNKALNYFSQAESIIQELENSFSMAQNLYNQGSVFLKINKLELAKLKLDEAMEIAKENEYNDLQTAILKETINLYERLGDISKAYKLQKEFLELIENSVISEENKKIEDIQLFYELENKEKEAEIFRLKNIELKKSLENSKKLSEKLKLKAEENERLLRVISHDLLTPLQVIIGLNDVMINSNKSLDDITLKKVNKVKSMAENMLNIINHIREMLAVESGKAVLRLQKVSIPDILDKAESVFFEMLKKKNLSLIIKYENPDQDYMVHVEPISFLNSVINNIISNSIKFSYPNSQIAIKIHDDSDYTYISIEDKGKGIDEKDLAEIFNSTKMTTTEGTQGEKGTGFGMPLAKKYIEQYNGIIFIESRSEKEFPENHGTKTTVKLKKVKN